MTQKLTNRQLLREYKMWKDKLLSGEVTELVIPQAGGKEFRVIVQYEMTPLERQLEMVKKHPIPSLRRPQRDII